MSDHQRPNLGTNSADMVVSAANMVFGQLPIFGSIFQEVVGSIIPNQTIDRIVKFLHYLEARLGKLEEETTKAKLRNPESIDILEDAFIQAARATTEERIEHIANVVANGLTSEEIDYAETKRMLWLLGQLNDSEIVILRSRLAITPQEAQDDSEFTQKHKELLSPITLRSGMTKDQIEDAAIRSSYRQHLQDLGLTRPLFKKPSRGEQPEFDDKTGTLKSTGSEITRLGRMLLRYLNLIPEWDRRS